MERAKRKKQVVPKNYKCKICGDAANDHYHFGAQFCCYPCKAFFRRAVKSNIQQPPCRLNGTCVITVLNRSTCPSCRYELCLKIGMDRKWVMDENDLAEKKEVAKLRQLLSNEQRSTPLQTEYQIKTKLGRLRKPKTKLKATNTDAQKVLCQTALSSQVDIPRQNLDHFLTVEEDNLVSRLNSIFIDAGRENPPDEILFQGLITPPQLQSVKETQKLNNQCQRLFIKRFDSVLDRIFKNRLMDGERRHLAQTNYDMVTMMFYLQLDFAAGDTLKDQLEFGTYKKVPEQYNYLSKIPKRLASDDFPDGWIGMENFAAVYIEKGKQIAPFLKRAGLSSLLYIFMMIQGSSSQEAQELHFQIRRLLLKKMRECQEFSCWPDPEIGLHFFYKNLSEFGLLMQNIIMASSLIESRAIEFE